jgi:hypothetical protein
MQLKTRVQIGQIQGNICFLLLCAICIGVRIVLEWLRDEHLDHHWSLHAGWTVGFHHRGGRRAEKIGSNR